MSTSSRTTGSTRLITRASTVAPTFAPHPPQRIATAESSRIASPPARPLGRSIFASPAMSGRSANPRTKRRSIRSFQRHTQSPSKTSAPPRVATARRSPVLMRLRYLRCG